MAEKLKRLVIVESPTKATKIAGYLGDGYIVESSRGHVRDLPTGAAEVPEKYKGAKWARIGVNIADDFAPLYVVAADKKGTIRELRAKLKQADELLLATDGDREGEAIAWHLLEELKPKVPARRMVFHEITPGAIAEAVANPRELDQDLVDAQETRRILDRLAGTGAGQHAQGPLQVLQDVNRQIDHKCRQRDRNRPDWNGQGREYAKHCRHHANQYKASNFQVGHSRHLPFFAMMAFLCPAFRNARSILHSRTDCQPVIFRKGDNLSGHVSPAKDDSLRPHQLPVALHDFIRGAVKIADKKPVQQLR